MKVAFAISMLLLSGCGSPDGSAPPGADSSGGDTALGGAAGASAGPSGGTAGGEGKPRCRAPQGMGSPGTIEQAVALLNVLPKPTSVACFVESLDRPLTMVATRSITSAQPALSPASPRVFLGIGKLWLSIVIDGDSSQLLELGYLIASEQDLLRSVKGELHFPLTSALEPGAPYERVLYQGGTICRLCHYDERPEAVPGIENVFSSVALRPLPETYVSTDALRIAAQICDWTLEPHRCEMLSAVFDGGPVIEGAFPQEMPTFF